MSKQRITEIKTIKIDAECKENPVYLTWKGPDGGNNAWLFHRRQTEADRIEAGEKFEPFIDDLETATSNGEYLSKQTTPQLILGADNFEIEDVRGIRGLLRSTKVEMLMNPATWEDDGPIWQTVMVDAGSFNILDTGANKASIEITLNLVKIYQQNQ